MYTVKSIRDKLGYTQQELANRTNLSLRTIQRIESGATIPKGHTLKVLSKALEIEPQLLSNTSEVNSDLIKSKIKLVNISALVFFLGIPFGNVLLPVITWKKHKNIDPLVDNAGKQIINFQILWSIFLSILLSLSPFIQLFFLPKFPLILIVLFVSICLNLFFIGWVATRINKGDYDFLCSNRGLI